MSFVTQDLIEKSPAKLSFSTAVNIAIALMFTAYYLIYDTTDAVLTLLICSVVCLTIQCFLNSKGVIKNHPNTFYIDIKKLDSIVRKDKDTKIDSLYLGKGFIFNPVHTRALYNLLDSGPLGLKNNGHGTAQIHALEKRNNGILKVNLKDLTGHTLIFGTTGSGKTRCFDLMITQAIMRDEVVIVIDPKGDRDLIEKTKLACSLYKSEDRFFYFDLNEKDKSCSLNPLSSSSSPSQIADKLSSLTSSAKGGDPFLYYAQEAICAAVAALKIKNQSISICSIKNHMNLPCYMHAVITAFEKMMLSDGIASDVKDTFKVSLNRYMYTSPRDDDGEKSSDETKGKAKGRVKAMSMAAFSSILKSLLAKIQQQMHVPYAQELELLLRLTTLNDEYFKKTTASVSPMLNALSLDGRDELLSSSAEESVSVSSIYKNKGVLYCALGSLKDASSASFLGKLLLSDLSSFAGDIYQGRFGNNPPLRVSLFVDEASEVANEALVQLLNKSRGANFAITIATQTYSDLSKRLGSADAAAQIAGNCNNLISLRLRDAQTAKSVTSALGTTSILTKQVSSSLSSPSSKLMLNESRSVGGRTTLVPIFPDAALLMLPDFEYVAKLADGRFIKGVLPIVSNEADK